MLAINRTSSATVTLTWLLRLRWVAILGQLLTMLIAAFALHADLPWKPLAGVLLTAAFFTLWRGRNPREAEQGGERQIALVMMVDVLLLAAVLYLTGGAHNPFTSFFLFHVALAAMTIATRWMWAVVGLCIACYGFITLYYWPLSIAGEEMAAHCSGYQWHLHGMAVAFVLTALCITVFVARMHRALRQREVELADAERRAVRGEQFTALATLSAGVAHEMGSPLGTIAVASHELEMALEKGARGTEALADVRLIRTEVERCRSILQRLNKDSTGGVGDAPEQFDVSRLFEELKAGVGSACANRLRLEDSTKGVSFFLPRAALVQALSVLIQNACQADQNGEPVILRIEQNAEFVNFRVLDSGPGLDSQTLRRAGEPFYTTKPAGQGMGLGLFLVRTLAKQLGGELTLENAPAGGACATLTLPLKEVPA